MLTTVFTCILLSGYAALGVALTVSVTETIKEDRRQSRRNDARERRETEYHEKRMKDLQ